MSSKQGAVAGRELAPIRYCAYALAMQQIAARRWIGVMPNVLSTLRLAMAVAFPLVPVRWRASVILVAGISDFSDGAIARRLGVTSSTGGILDAVTDKAFVLSVLITLVIQECLTPWHVVLLLSRDGVVWAIVAYVALMRRWSAFRHMPARRYGKLTTASMFVFFLVITIWPEKKPLFHTVFALTVLLSIVAAVDYIHHFLHAYSEDQR